MKKPSDRHGRERLGGTGLGLAGGRRWSLTQGLHSYLVNSQEGRPRVATLLSGCFSPSHCLEMFREKWGGGVKWNKELQQCTRQVETGQKIKGREKGRDCEMCEQGWREKMWQTDRKRNTWSINNKTLSYLKVSFLVNKLCFNSCKVSAESSVTHAASSQEIITYHSYHYFYCRC